MSIENSTACLFEPGAHIVIARNCTVLCALNKIPAHLIERTSVTLGEGRTSDRARRDPVLNHGMDHVSTAGVLPGMRNIRAKEKCATRTIIVALRPRHAPMAILTY